MEKLHIINLKIINVPNTKELSFTRRELSLILSIYSSYVAKGIWRDYALDFKNDYALFSFYRHTYELPIFSIEKRFSKSKQNISFTLKKRNIIKYSSNNLLKVIKKLHLFPKLINLK